MTASPDRNDICSMDEGRRAIPSPPLICFGRLPVLGLVAVPGSHAPRHVRCVFLGADGRPSDISRTKRFLNAEMQIVDVVACLGPIILFVGGVVEIAGASGEHRHRVRTETAETKMRDVEVERMEEAQVMETKAVSMDADTRMRGRTRRRSPHSAHVSIGRERNAYG